MEHRTHSEPDDRRSNRDGDGPSRDPAAQGGSWMWEPVTAFIGATLVLGLVAFLAYQAVFGQDVPPDLVLRQGATAPNGEDYLVEILAHNRGDETAAQVKITGRLKQDETVVEEAEFTLDYVPPHSERGGGLFFRHDPRRLTLELAATGYAQP